MNLYKPGDVYRDLFPIQNASGAATNADSLPTASLYRNNAIDNAVTVTVVNVTTGIYSLSCTIPSSYSAGDTVQVLINATIGGTAAKATRPPARLVAFDATNATDIGLTSLQSIAGYIDSLNIFSGQSAGATASTITLEGGDTTNGYYENYIIRLDAEDETWLGQYRTIIAWNGSTQVATVDSPFDHLADISTAFFTVYPPSASNMLQRIAASTGAYGGTQSQANGIITQVLDKPDGGTLTRVYEGGTMVNTDTA